MLTAIKNFISKAHPRLILVSLFLSFILWFFSLNVADPITFGNFNLNLQIRNADALTERQRLILNESEILNYIVSVHVTGPLSQLDSLVRNQTIVAFIDVNASELVHVPGSGMNEPIPVRINVAFARGAAFDELQITHVYPDTVNVVVDRIETRIFETRLIFDPEELPEGYIALDAERDPARVTLVGPWTTINQIDRSSVGVRLDVSNARVDLVGVDVPITAYNEFGYAITGFSINVDTMNFRLPILRTQTAHIVLGETIGEISPEFAITSIDWEPREVALVGHVDEEHTDIVLDSIDISGITGTTAINVSISEHLERVNREHGTDFALKNPAQNTVVVTITTEPRVSRDFTITRDHIAISGEFGRIELLDEYVIVTLRDIASVLDELEEADIRVVVDAAVMAGYEDGEYRLFADVILPPGLEGLELYGEIPVVTIRLLTN